jgi:hypothetical protein
LLEFGGFDVFGDGVQVDDAEYIIVFILFGSPAAYSAQVVPELRASAGFDTGKNAFLHLNLLITEYNIKTGVATR